MKRTLRILPDARADVARLEAWLEGKSPRAAVAAALTIATAIESLTDYPDRGKPLDSAGLRELVVRFGRDGYVIRYRSQRDLVLITRVFHGLEQR